MPADPKLLEKIAKIFAFGADTRNRSEHEMLAAVTRARELMVKHAISLHDVQAEVDRLAGKKHQPSFTITTYQAYTRKISNLAQYDEIVATAVGFLTDTRPLIYHTRMLDRSTYTTLKFLGAEGDIEVASTLFMILLKSVRDRASDTYGRGKNTWSKHHTSYAIGFAVRMAHRAREISGLSAKEQATWGLVLASKTTAIQRWMEEHAAGPSKRKKTEVDSIAYARGYEDGADISLDKKGVAS